MQVTGLFANSKDKVFFLCRQKIQQIYHVVRNYLKQHPVMGWAHQRLGPRVPEVWFLQNVFKILDRNNVFHQEPIITLQKFGSFLASGGAGKNKLNLGNSNLSCSASAWVLEFQGLVFTECIQNSGQKQRFPSGANYNTEKIGSFLASGGSELGKNKLNLGNSNLSCFLFHFNSDRDFLQEDPWVGSLEPLIIYLCRKISNFK